MDALKTLTINACSIKDFTVLKDTNVNTLSLGLMSNSDFSSLKGNEKINSLELQRLSKLPDLNILTSLPNLQYCHVSHNNHIEKVPNMGRCENVKALVFGSIKKLSDISELAFVPNVERIEMYQLKLVDLLSIEDRIRVGIYDDFYLNLA